MIRRLLASLGLAGWVFLCCGCTSPEKTSGNLEESLPVEGIYFVTMSTPTTFTLLRPLPHDEATGKPSRPGLTVWCADSCLTAPSEAEAATLAERQAYASALETAKRRFAPQAEEIIARGKDALERSQMLRKALHETWSEAGVSRLLREYLARELPKVDSCIRRCVEGSIDVSSSDDDLAPWQRMVAACTSTEEDLASHIVMHPNDPALSEEYRRAARSLLYEERFRRCLRESVRQHPPLPEEISRLHIGGDSDEFDRVRRATWEVWEAAGVPRIIEEAAKESPDMEKIGSLIDACLSGEAASSAGPGE